MYLDNEAVLPPEARGYDVVVKSNILFAGRDNATADIYFLFDRRNPLAAEIFLTNATSGEDAKWIVARDILHKAAVFAIPAGEGDFRARLNTEYALVDPSRPGAPVEETLVFHFVGFDEHDVPMQSLGFVLRKVVKFFVAQTVKIVPRGDEKYDIDKLISQLLAV
jgi:hypothetical protein